MPTKCQTEMHRRGISRLLNVDKNAKTVKGQKAGYLTGILYLAPARLSGFEVCPMRSPGCTAACLNTAGKGGMPHAQQSRINKTRWYFEDRGTFMAQLVREIAALARKGARMGLTPVVRLNGTSDIPWERVKVGPEAVRETEAITRQPVSNQWADKTLVELFPTIQFYDYTKITKRAVAAARGDAWPSNYALTFSLTEDNDTAALQVLCAGGQVSMVFAAKKSEPLPPWASAGLDLDFRGHQSARSITATRAPIWPVVDGDETDLRFLDKRGVVVGLYPKGRARRDTSGFVRPICA